MYFAGLRCPHRLSDLPLTHDQGVESIVFLTTLGGLFLACGMTQKALKIANAEGGHPKPATTSSSKCLWHRFVNKAQLFGTWGPPHVYIIGTALNRMEQPDWFSDWALPTFDLGFGGIAIVKTLACVVNGAAICLAYHSFKHLGNNFCFTGVREKTKTVETGPYSVIRHPLYASILLAQASWAWMWWSYIPLVGLGLSAISFAAKIPIEERIREEDPLTGVEYSSYSKKVKYRLIPYVW
ncbi:hypothetical protein C8Q75DRAFT_776579 [Abortiporus biennis]|nr:hypothetical protein C8Q75DRAFT_776579 [Abortiporus biennis]